LTWLDYDTIRVLMSEQLCAQLPGGGSVEKPAADFVAVPGDEFAGAPGEREQRGRIV
jgi:hypothetical protein